MIMLLCYLSVLFKLKICSKRSSNILTYKNATKKILCYILVFTIHWVPIVIQNIGRMLKV